VSIWVSKMSKKYFFIHNIGPRIVNRHSTKTAADKRLASTDSVLTLLKWVEHHMSSRWGWTIITANIMYVHVYQLYIAHMYNLFHANLCSHIRQPFFWGGGGSALCLFSCSALHFVLIILFWSTILSNRMTGISLHMLWPLTSQLHGSILKKNNCFFVTD
jgi:hypothetical protein